MISSTIYLARCPTFNIFKTDLPSSRAASPVSSSTYTPTRGEELYLYLHHSFTTKAQAQIHKTASNPPCDMPAWPFRKSYQLAFPSSQLFVSVFARAQLKITIFLFVSFDLPIIWICQRPVTATVLTCLRTSPYISVPLIRFASTVMLALP